MDLTMAQFKLLLLVAEHDGLRVGDLAQTLGVTPPTVTASLDRLVAHGLVLRQDDPIDRRLVIARATPEGRALLGRLHVLTHREVLDCLQEMTESELENLFIGMAALHRVWSNRQNGFDHDDRKAPSLGPA
jgi:DNA-binding MarR family transcriptional regulator